jgi:hypothetical protein
MRTTTIGDQILGRERQPWAELPPDPDNTCIHPLVSDRADEANGSYGEAQSAIGYLRWFRERRFTFPIYLVTY